MDLVAAYESDAEQNRIIDVIEIDDSDSDVDVESTTVTSSTTTQDNCAVDVSNSKQPSCSKENSDSTVKEIECITIDIDVSSDLEESPIEVTNTPKENIEKDKTDPKSVDYLNLNDSDSEDEPTVLKQVNNLLESAAILNDKPCGPEISSSVNKTLIRPVSNTNKEPELEIAVPTSSKNIDSLSHFDGKTKLENMLDKISTDSFANKHFRRESETPRSATSVINTELGENQEISIPNSFMYRRDERISIALDKHIVCRLPRQISRHYINHMNVVTSLEWCVPQYSHLLLSASADCTAKIWDMYCKNAVQTFKDILGIKAAKWSYSGEQILMGGFGKKARVYDVLSGKEIVSYDAFNYVHSLAIHPDMEDVFLCGTRNAIFGFDIRVNSHLPIRSFFSKCEEVLDIVFLGENEFISSTSVVNHDSADRTIMVWDFLTGAIMSNQIYLERYTCPHLKVHPSDSTFIAQTNGDYIAAFSTHKPYKIKEKRYMGHKVSGFGVECDISPDGKYIASGDANGDIYFYSYTNTNVISKLTARPNMATNRLKWHPAFNSTLATATWDGHIQIWK